MIDDGGDTITQDFYEISESEISDPELITS